jgi:hypothetical protein
MTFLKKKINLGILVNLYKFILEISIYVNKFKRVTLIRVVPWLFSCWHVFYVPEACERRKRNQLGCLLAGESWSVICKWKALILAIIDNSEIEKQNCISNMIWKQSFLISNFLATPFMIWFWELLIKSPHFYYGDIHLSTIILITLICGVAPSH